MNQPERLRRPSLKRYTDQLSLVKSVPYLPDLEIPNFKTFFQFVLKNFIRAARDYDEGKVPKPPRFLIFTEGEPQSGKTHIINATNGILEILGRHRFAERLTQGSTRWFSHKTWERDGLAVARGLGFITTSRDEVANPEGLMAANYFFQSSLVESIDNSYFTSVEKPIGAIRQDAGADETDFFKKWLGRPMGEEGAYNLFRREGPFKGIDDIYNVQCFAAGVCGAPIVQIFDKYRDEIKGARTWRDAARKSYKYAKRPPKSQEELLQMQADGASLEQMKVISDVVYSLLLELESRGEFKLPRVARIVTDYLFEDLAELREKAGIDDPFPAAVRFMSGLLLKYIFEHDRKIEKGKSVIGYNKPTFKQLGIDARRQAALRSTNVRTRMTTHPDTW